MNKFDSIQALLGLTEKEKSQVLSINMANNPNRKYKEVWVRHESRINNCFTDCYKRVAA
jgi:hypothetical protein